MAATTLDRIEYVDPIIPAHDKSPKGSRYRIVDINLAFAPVVVSYVFDGSLDLEIFKLALAHAVGRVRGFAGRYEMTRSENGEQNHKIVLTDLPIAVKFARSPISGLNTPRLPDSIVVHNGAALAPFVYRVPNFIPSNPPGNHEVDPKLDLLRLQITELYKGEEDKQRVVKSVLGFHWEHIIGDANLACQFTSLLSTIYTHLSIHPEIRKSPEIDLSSLHLPIFTYEHVDFPIPSLQVQQDRWLLQATSIPVQKAKEMYAEVAAKPAEMMTITLTDNEVQSLRKRIQHGCDKDVRISRQDAITAWWVQLVRAGGPNEVVDRVINTTSWRDFYQNTSLIPFRMDHCVGNVVQTIPLSIPPNSSPSQTASLVRANHILVQTSPRACEEWLSNAAFHYRKTVDEGHMHFFPPDPNSNEVLVNSNLRYSWLTGAMFGFKKGQVEYHFEFGTLRFLRVFQPNPGALPEGEEGTGAEMSFVVPLEQAERIKSLAQQHRRELWAALT